MALRPACNLSVLSGKVAVVTLILSIKPFLLSISVWFFGFYPLGIGRVTPLKNRKSVECYPMTELSINECVWYSQSCHVISNVTRSRLLDNVTRCRWRRYGRVFNAIHSKSRCKCFAFCILFFVFCVLCFLFCVLFLLFVFVFYVLCFAFCFCVLFLEVSCGRPIYLSIHLSFTVYPSFP